MCGIPYSSNFVSLTSLSLLIFFLAPFAAIASEFILDSVLIYQYFGYIIVYKTK